MLERKMLNALYTTQGLSAAQISKKLRCSENKVNYWLAHHGIKKRSISEAIYQKWNPSGDPFALRKPTTHAESFLSGLGIGLYWGEGTKKAKSSVRLGNSDPRLIRAFIMFLKDLYGVDTHRLRFGLQVFGDMSPAKAKAFWVQALCVRGDQFYATVITPHRGIGNYRQKTKYGVVTVYFNNRKLRDILCDSIERVSIA
jgi:hypothetical protein